MKDIIIILILLIGILFPGCGLYSSYDEVTISLPGIPTQWQERFSSFTFFIHYLDINGKEVCVTTIPGESLCTLEIPRIRHWPVVAYPLGDTFLLPPAGGFYTLEMGSSTEPVLALTWEKGFSASLLKECCEQGFDIPRFNVARFQEEVLKRSQRDPWDLDPGMIIEHLLAGDFRVTHIQSPRGVGISLFLDQGKWFFSSPFSPVYEMNTGGSFSFDHVPLGFHRLFHVDSPSWYELYVTEEETIVAFYGKNCGNGRSFMPGNP
jgi:hypothetical protein